MTALVSDSRFADPDRAYRALIEAHRGLTDEESAALNSRLVLILANHIGDLNVLQEALALAKQSMDKPEAPTNR
jgi:predicted metal-dependent hydrolase